MKANKQLLGVAYKSNKNQAGVTTIGTELLNKNNIQFINPLIESLIRKQH